MEINKMAKIRNKVSLIGNVDSIKQEGNEKKVVIKMTTEALYGDVKWIHTTQATGKTAEFANTYIERGNRIAISGMLMNGQVLIDEIMLLTQKQ